MELEHDAYLIGYSVVELVIRYGQYRALNM